MSEIKGRDSMGVRNQTGGRSPMGGRGPVGGRGMMMPGEKAKDFKGSIRKLAGYLGNHRAAILLAFLLSAASTVFTIIGPKILGKATDEIFNGFLEQTAGTGSIDFDIVTGILAFLAGLYLVSALFAYLQGFLMTGISIKTTYRLRRGIDEKIHRLPLKYFDQTTHGEVLSRITNDVDTINQTLGQSLMQIVTSVTSLLGIAVMMFTISPRLTLVTLLILPLSAVFVAIIIRKSQKHFKNQQKYLGDVNGHIEEMFGSHTVVKAYSGEEASLKAFDELNEALYHSAWKANFLSGLMMPVTGFIGNLTYVAVCILGGYFTVTGGMTVGGIQAFIQYVRSFSQPISGLANISNVLQLTAAASERVFAFLAEEEEQEQKCEQEQEAVRIAETGKPLPQIVFDHVSFGYEKDRSVLRNFSAEFKRGQKIAIVGPTGAGKTTLVKLLMRFYEVNSGCIRIDGQDIRQFPKDRLRVMFGMVLQDTWLFNGTIADNIRYGRLNAGEDEVIEAAKAAQADHFIRTLPDGYHMIINEEADNISQGQKQLLTIARAILADPAILILDEATSNVDTRTEVLIQKAMDHLMEGRTSFVIAHRLSTIRNADRILVINQGDIVEQGTHKELIEQDGFYAGLYESQFERN